MFEYTIYPTGDKVTINPNYICYIRQESACLTKISLCDGTTLIVETPYEEVKKQYEIYIS